jgi:AcrR family transcriptional regulator
MHTPRKFSDLKGRERENRQNIIIDAAERVFASKPFDEVNMRDIASEAGISHATIYRYFPDQQTLFMEAFLRGVQQVLPRIEEAVESNQDAPGDVAADVFIDFLFEKDHYFKMMTHFMLDGALNPELFEKLNTAGRLILDQIEELFRRYGAVKETRILAHAFFASLNGILITFRNFPGRSRDEVLRHMKVLGRVTACLFKDAIERGSCEFAEESLKISTRK